MYEGTLLYSINIVRISELFTTRFLAVSACYVKLAVRWGRGFNSWFLVDVCKATGDI